MDWLDEKVIEALNDYSRRDNLKTLRELQAQLFNLTGITVSTATVCRRVHGKRTRTKCGRPSKRPKLEEKDKKEEKDGTTTTEKDFKCSASPFQSEEEELSLSKALKNSVLIVNVGDGMVRRYVKIRSSANGETTWFSCTKCRNLIQKKKIGKEPYVSVRNGKISVPSAEHQPECKPVHDLTAIAAEADRQCRKQVKTGQWQPYQAWNKGHSYLVKRAKEENWEEEDNLPAEFPAWQKVRSQYHRLTRKAFPEIKDPYSLPEQYKQFKCHEERLGHVMPITEGLSWVDAAAIPEVWLIAYQLLKKTAEIKDGESVLIHAGGSGVGTAAVQLVRNIYNGTVFATVCSEEKRRFVSQLGAQHVINYKAEDFVEKIDEITSGKGVDIVLDCIGGSYWEKNIKSLTVGGRWVLYGLLSGGEVNGNFLGQVIRKQIRLEGTTLRSRSAEYKSSLIADFSEEILPHFETGKLTAVVDSTFPMGRIADAHKRLEENKNIGKVVVLVQNECIPLSPASNEFNL